MLKTRVAEGKYLSVGFFDDGSAQLKFTRSIRADDIDKIAIELYDVQSTMEGNKRYDERQSVSNPQ